MAYDRVRCLPTVKIMPDELWDEIKLILLPEKPTNTIGRPVVSYRKVLSGWHSICIKYWVSMEDVATGIWFMFDMS